MKSTIKRVAMMFVALSAVVLLSTSSYAQKKEVNLEERAEDMTEQLDEKLDLNDEQEDKIEAITLKYLKLADKERKETTDRRELMTKMRKSQEDKNAEFKKVLTAKQYKKYEKYLEEQKEKMRGRRPQGGGSRR